MSASPLRRSGSTRWELIGALAAGCDTPSASSAATRTLGFGATSKEDHTTVFVLNLPPYASIYLGAEGQLGGEAGDRVAGFWRSVGIVPDADPDHLASLLALYAQLGAARDDAASSAAVTALERMRLTLLWEHLWPWVPAYTRAVQSLDIDPLARWARLLRATLANELSARTSAVDEQPPLALRHAPGPLDATGAPGALLDGLVAPVRSGMILTRRSLAAATQDIGVGYRLGERRFALKAMMEQDPPSTVAWLSDEAERWATLHAANGPDDINRWWAARAGQNATGLRQAQSGHAVVVAGAQTAP
jgi:TorA maturation chaperone TorD